MNPLISVIIPVFNVVRFCPKCIHSILSQTFQDFELLLIDDGSTDGSEKLCDRLASENERIQTKAGQTLLVPYFFTSRR